MTVLEPSIFVLRKMFYFICTLNEGLYTDQHELQSYLILRAGPEESALGDTAIL